jgi:hypothetical protein
MSLLMRTTVLKGTSFLQFLQGLKVFIVFPQFLHFLSSHHHTPIPWNLSFNFIHSKSFHLSIPSFLVLGSSGKDPQSTHRSRRPTCLHTPPIPSTCLLLLFFIPLSTSSKDVSFWARRIIFGARNTVQILPL